MEYFIKLFIILLCIAPIVIFAIVGGWEIVAVVGALIFVAINI